MERTRNKENQYKKYRNLNNDRDNIVKSHQNIHDTLDLYRNKSDNFRKTIKIVHDLMLSLRKTGDYSNQFLNKISDKHLSPMLKTCQELKQFKVDLKKRLSGQEKSIKRTTVLKFWLMLRPIGR